MTSTAQSTGSTLRRVVAFIVLVPLAVILIAFSVANRQAVTVSLDPFSAGSPTASVTQPLFVVLIVVLILGVVVGGLSAWLRQIKWRRTARRLDREVRELRADLDAVRRGPAGMADAADPPARLQLQPPLR